MPVKEASSEETPYGRYVTSEGWFVVNLTDALAVRNEEKGGALYPLEPREVPFGDVGVHVRVLWPGDPNALYHSEGAQEGFLVLSGECTLIVEEEERPLRQWDYFHCPAGTPHLGGSRRRAVRDSHDRRAARSRDAALPGERGGGEVRGVRREGDRGTGRGVRRLAGRVSAGAPSVAV
jgi:mannose-6-phosphate isomerase-like protein (cupin superfamily)